MSDIKDEKVSTKFALESEKYIQKIVKLIPTEVLAVYLALVNFVPKDLVPQIVLSVICLALVPVYLLFATKVKNVMQVIVSTLGFGIWVIASGGTLSSLLTMIEPWMMGVGLMIFSFLVPIFFKEEEEKVSTAAGSKVVVKSWREI